MRRQGSGAPSCRPNLGCVTCSDEALPVRVVEVLAQARLAVCEDDAGARLEIMTDLVEPVAVGDRLLVHAGTALQMLGPDPAFPLRS